jgi:hypothetical protein
MIFEEKTNRKGEDGEGGSQKKILSQKLIRPRTFGSIRLDSPSG